MQVEGEAQINGIELEARDAMELVEEDIKIVSKTKAHVLVIEMKKQ